MSKLSELSTPKQLKISEKSKLAIIQSHKKPSAPVENYAEIKKEAEELVKLTNSDSFTGKWREALALAHCQVSEDPKAFFAIRRNLKDLFESEIIVNAKILSKDEDSRVTFPAEACMSFPFRDAKKTIRYREIEVEYEIPVFGFFGPRNGLKKIRKTVNGLVAFIFQHETDHFHGVNIYGK